MKNKKASISIKILVIGVLLICGLALLSFSFSINGVNELSAVSVLEKIKIQKDKIEFYNNLDVDFPEGEFDVRTENVEGRPLRDYLFMQEAWAIREINDEISRANKDIIALKSGTKINQEQLQSYIESSRYREFKFKYFEYFAKNKNIKMVLKRH